MKNARNDLTIFCGDDKNALFLLLRDEAKRCQSEKQNANILVMSEDDQEGIFRSFTKIPECSKDGSACRGFIMSTMARLDPDLIVIDEIRTPGEALAVVRMAESGDQLVTAIHAESEEEALALWDELTKEFQQLSPKFFQNRVSVNWVGKRQPRNTARQHLQG